MLGAPAAPVVIARTGAAASARPMNAPAPRQGPPVSMVPPPARGPLVDASVAAAVAAAAEPAPGFGPRRPLVGNQGQVAGFELRLAPAAERFLAARGDSPGAAVHYAGLLSTAAGITAGGRAALLRMPAVMLARANVFNGVAAGMWLLIDDLAAVPAPTAQALRARGALLGVADGPPTAAGHADFVVAQAGAGAIDTLVLSAQRWRERLPGVAIVGLGFEHVEDMEAALRSAVALAGGQLGRSRDAPPPKPLGAAAHRICELLNHLAMDHETGVVAEAVRGDAALTYRLLRYANSPAVGAKQGVETVDTAVALLGRQELRRWLSVQLMLSAGSARQAAKALEEGALVRGRVLELIARKLGESNPGAHFTLGLLSVIEPLLQVPLKDAITPLRLGDEATAALLRREGPWAARLRLLDALDAGESGQAEAMACELGLPEGALTGIVDDAWGWSTLVRDEGPAG
jgi:EAL and modified HD-GYP domain-containing signal transduction protein